ncbi:methyl-accepting chemotaxis protein [Erwinia sp. 198]|uniref:methyl-accepting chemotaxis protein n=1 Tax=Erwinia sp. 198 TaxID=2022746 RepID=UPI000F686C94|nr:methyl-accepting chemotaxis protein [Erwinia sp. 198]RRZ95666.1 HAMP domain-containing protein [Erwinia sp. 198]
MNITQRLFLTFTLLAVALCTLAAVSFSIISGFQSRFEYVQNNAIPSIKDLNKSISAASGLGLALYKHQALNDDTKLPAAERHIDDTLDELKKLTDYYMANDISNAEDRSMTEQIYRDIDAVRADLPAFLNASRAQNESVTLALLQGESGIGAAGRKLASDLNKQIELNIQIGNELKKINKEIYSKTLWMMSTAVLLVIVLLSFFAVKTILNIRRSLLNIEGTMLEVSNTLDLTRHADDSRADEIGKTASAFNKLLTKFSETLTAVNSASLSVSSGSSQIAAGNEDLSSRTEQQAASLEETSSSMAALSETVKNNSFSASEASTLADSANRLSAENGQSVKNMLDTMEDIRTSSGKISEITGLIEGISFQTNILALNAAVEAARAGEHGRGFAVVASEVRNLAQRSSSAAKEIKDLINASVMHVESGAQQAASVGENSAKVTSSINQVATIVNEIATSAAEQSRGIEQVHLAIGQMDEVTQQNAALVEEASSASRSLQDQAETLSQLVSAFKLTSDTPTYKKTETFVKPSVSRTPAKAAAVSAGDWESF